MNTKRSKYSSEVGAALIEYPIIAAAIAAVVFFVLLSTSMRMNEVFNAAGSQTGLNPVSDGGSGSSGGSSDPGGSSGSGGSGGSGGSSGSGGSGGGGKGGYVPVDGSGML